MIKKVKFSLYLLLTLLIVGCKEDDPASDVLVFSTCGDYPPFEYYEQGVLTGFDIEVAKLIAQELGKKAVFKEQDFTGVLTALSTGQADVAIATLTVTEGRKKNFDFSDVYYTEGLVAVFKEGQPITSQSDLAGKQIATQLGSTMEIWLKNNVADADVTLLDTNIQAIEALKAGYVEVVLLDAVQGAVFCRKNPGLAYAPIAEADSGYAIAVAKNSPLKPKINAALAKLEAHGSMQKLKAKWLEGAKWNS